MLPAGSLEAPQHRGCITP